MRCAVCLGPLLLHSSPGAPPPREEAGPPRGPPVSHLPCHLNPGTAVGDLLFCPTTSRNQMRWHLPVLFEKSKEHPAGTPQILRLVPTLREVTRAVLAEVGWCQAPQGWVLCGRLGLRPHSRSPPPCPLDSHCGLPSSPFLSSPEDEGACRPVLQSLAASLLLSPV